MMATPVIMPKFGMAQEEGQILRWYVQEGDAVKEGQPLLEVMTDKVSMEVEAPASGILRGVRAFADDVVPVAQIIAYIVAPDEEWVPPALEAPSAPEVTAQPRAAQAASPAAAATPVAKRLAAEAGIDLSQVPGTGAGGKVTRRDVETHLAERAEMQAPAPPSRTGKVRATPAARRLARQHGLYLERVAGSGPRGRIQGRDVEAFLDRPPSWPAPETPGERIIPLHGMRRIIAERMAASARTAPHISLSLHADVSRFEALRQEINQRLAAQEGPKVSFSALLVRVLAWALRHHPWLNARLEEDNIHLLPDIHIGVATDVEEGLIVPVIRNADRKGLVEIARQLNDLTERARQGRLLPDEVTGSTFTMTNLGMFGIESFTAILNPPEVGILAVGAIQQLPVAREGDRFSLRPMVSLNLAADHRVVDGATAARFLADLKAAIEAPHLLLL
jgi:pyruvate dehydrogenase E2 component (dihydrolipoamide acetyltransferase)